jgi:hypothetical protein
MSKAHASAVIARVSRRLTTADTVNAAIGVKIPDTKSP